MRTNHAFSAGEVPAIALAEPLLIAQAARAFKLPLKRLRRAARSGEVRAQQVNGYWWLVDRESTRAFAASWHAKYGRGRVRA